MKENCNLICETKDNYKKSQYTDLTNINRKKFLSQNDFIIDLGHISSKDLKNTIKKINAINRHNLKRKNYIKNIHVLNYNKNNLLHIDFIDGIKASFIKDKEEQYSFIYDKVCTYLDNKFAGENLCDFKNDKCGEKINTSSEVGCCKHYKNRIIDPFLPKSRWVKCEYLKNRRCTIKCISCKLYTCDYLRKKGVYFKLKDIFLIDTFFNLTQKYVIKKSVYTLKEKIIHKLMVLG